MLSNVLPIHLLLSIVIFFIINWIGKHSVSLGYITLTAFVSSDDAPAFNLIFRILSPIVLIVLLSSFLYSIGQDKYVVNIWMVTFFYCVCRLLFILIFERIYLVNWFREIFIWLTTTGLSWIIYEYFIKLKSNLLPQPEELKNEFWILLILFIYSVFNKIELDGNTTERRKKNYLIKVYNEHKLKYQKVISSVSVDALSESLIYAILLYENFNRPRLIRLIERLAFPHLARTIGPMQVKTAKRISDSESVRLGSSKIVEAYRKALSLANEKAIEKGVDFNPFVNGFHMRFLEYSVAADYNKDDSYVNGVVEMHEQLITNIYTTFTPKETSYSSLDYYLSNL